MVTIMDRTILYLDEGYIFCMKKKLMTQGKTLNVVDLANGIARSQGLWCARAYYYTAPPFMSAPPTEYELRMAEQYRNFKGRLCRTAPHFVVREGRLQRTASGFKQKGVDTLVTIDLLEEPFEEEGVATIILVTGDSDFIPAIEKLRSRGMKVLMACFEPDNNSLSISKYLVDACDRLLVLKEKAAQNADAIGEPMPAKGAANGR